MRLLVASAVLLLAGTALADGPDAAELFASCRLDRGEKVVMIGPQPGRKGTDVAALIKTLSCKPVEIAKSAYARLRHPAELATKEKVTWDEAFNLMRQTLAHFQVEVVAVSPQALRIQARR